MDLSYEIVLSVTSLIIGVILGWLTNWHFYKKQSKENEANAETLKQLGQYADAQIRVGNDKRGKIVKRPDGTIAIEWQVDLSSSVTVDAKAKIEVKKRNEPEQ